MHTNMNIKKYLNKKHINSFALLTIGFVVGLAVMYLYFQPKLMYQGETVKDWAKKDIECEPYANLKRLLLNVCEDKLASAGAELKTLQNKPPQVEYKTQYIETPAQNTSSQNSYTQCNSDLIGGQNCTTYHSGGNPTFTHCTSNLIGGMNCN